MNSDLVFEKIIVLNQLTNFGRDYYEEKRDFFFCIYILLESWTISYLRFSRMKYKINIGPGQTAALC